MPSGTLTFQKFNYIFRDEKRGYNSLQVENLVDLPPQKDPTDPLFQHQWYLVSNLMYFLVLQLIIVESCQVYLLKS